MNTSITQTMLK